MNVYEKVKELASLRKVSIARLERELNLSNGSISKWAYAKPNSEPLEKVANYFNVSVDYLLGRTDISSVSTDVQPSPKALTVAAHIDDDVTEEQMENILNYIEFITNKHKKD